ncbi:MAG: clostripain-related cysteine peptidase, partial [Thermoplasmata archaeon]
DTYGKVTSSNNGLTIAAGQDFMVEAEIWNGFIASTGPFSIDLYIDETDGTPKFCGRVNCPGLAIGEVFKAKWTGVFTSISGSTPIRVVADSTNAVPESNENNNQKILIEPVIDASRTIAIYSCADNDLELYELNNFLLMASAGSGSSEHLNIVVMMDRYPGGSIDYGNWEDAKYFFVKEGITPDPENALLDIGEVNMGDPNSLYDFATWTFDRYRADNYILIMANHGNAFVGVCEDWSSNYDRISVNELGSVLQDITNHIEKNLEIIGFDACLLSWIENEYAYHDWAKAIVASVEPMPIWTQGLFGAWPYDKILSQLRNDPYMTTENLCSIIVQEYYNITLRNPSQYYKTIAAYKGSGIGNVTLALDALSDVLIGKVGDSIIKSQIQAAREAMIEYPADPHVLRPYGVDPYDMAVQLQIACDDAQIDAATQNVIDAMLDPNTVIDYAGGNPVVGYCYNLSKCRLLGLLWTKEAFTVDFWDYSTLQFCTDTSWDEFLIAYFNMPVASIDSISPNPANLGQTVNFNGHGTDSDGTIVAYNWRSSIDGQLSTSASFSTSTLSPGAHTIYFKVQDNDLQWSTEVQATLFVNGPNELRLTNNNGDSMKPAIAVDSLGNYHIVWQEASDGNNEIYYIRLDTDYNILTPQTRLTSNAYDSIDPDIAVSSSGVIKVIWCDNRDGNYEIYFKTYDPATGWGKDTRLTKTTSANDREPDAEVDSSGNFYFVWHDIVVNNNGQTEKIWFSVNGGTPASIYTATGPKGGRCDKISEPRLACGATGIIHLAFALGPAYPAETGTESIMYMRRTSSTWSAVSTLKSSTGNEVSYWASIDADSSGNVYVGWNQLISLNPYSRGVGFIRSSNGGISWNTDIVVPGTEGTGCYPEVSCLSGGIIYLGFYNCPGGFLGVINCAKSSDFGVQWSIQIISSNDVNSDEYKICADPATGKVGIAWECAGERTNWNFEIFFSSRLL